jgi:hypothetical protein
VLGSGAALLATTPVTWVRATTSTAVQERVDVLATGAAAAPGVTAAGLLVVAAALALAMARRWGAVVASVAVGGGGVLAVASALAVAADPDGVAIAAARTVSGVGVLAGVPLVTPALWAAVVLGGLVALLGVVIGVLSRRWQPAPVRYAAGRPEPRSGAGAAHVTPPESWDALSRGEDPTE